MAGARPSNELESIQRSIEGARRATHQVDQWRMSRGQQRPSRVSVGWAWDIAVRGARAAAGSIQLGPDGF